MDPERLKEIQELFERGMAIRAIARKLGHDPKTVRRALARPRKAPVDSKLERFKPLVRELSEKELRAPRILREIREKGYEGGLTILKLYLQEIRGPTKAPRKVFQRFETPAAEEGQVDWSPYRLLLGSVSTVVHCFSLVLCYSRRLWIGFFRNERLPTLLYAHVEALRYHEGSCRRLVYDNQTTVTLGRVDGRPLWHPTFLEFSKFYGFTPYAAKVGHKERKGKVERPFFYIEEDFLRGTVFDSLADLNEKARRWLDTVANVRKHTTTKRRVDELYLEEKPLLISLPETSFPTERREVRKVQKDGYLSLDGSFYPVPAHLVGQYVTVRVYPTRVEILDAAGQLALAHAIPDSPTRVRAPGQAPSSAPPSLSLTALETRFLARFPRQGDFLSGLKRRMNALTPIHLRRIEGLVDLYGEENTALAIDRAAEYRNFNALSIARILERAHPNVIAEPPVEPLTAGPEVLGALDDVDSGSPEEYTLDSMPPTETLPHETEE